MLAGPRAGAPGMSRPRKLARNAESGRLMVCQSWPIVVKLVWSLMLSKPSSVSRLSLKCLASPRASIRQVVAPACPRSPGLDRNEAKPPLRSRETSPSNTAWPAWSCRRRLRETPPMTRSSMARQASTDRGSLKSKSSTTIRGPPISSAVRPRRTAWRRRVASRRQRRAAPCCQASCRAAAVRLWPSAASRSSSRSGSGAERSVARRAAKAKAKAAGSCRN